MNVRSKEKRKLILDATMELIAEYGLHNTPMSQVSIRSGVSVGTIYHYFSSKEEIINTLYIEMKKESLDVAFHAYTKSASYKKRFFQIWMNYFDYLIANPLKLSFVEQCSTSPLITEETREATIRYYAPLIEFIEEGIKSQHLKKMEMELLLSLISGSLVSSAKLQLSGSFAFSDKHKRLAAESCWDGLKR